MSAGEEKPPKGRGEKAGTESRDLPEKTRLPAPREPRSAGETPAKPGEERRFVAAKKTGDSTAGAQASEEWDIFSRGEQPVSAVDSPEGETGTIAGEAEAPESTNRPGKRRKKPQVGWATRLREIVSFRIPAYWALVGAVLPFAFLAAPVFQWGESAGKKRADEAAFRERLSIPPEIAVRIDDALLKLREGDTAGALSVLHAIEAEKGFYPSLSYLVALAAVQSGDVNLAERKIKETIEKRERVSDALALQAVVESMKPADPTRAVMGDPKVRAENLLRQAIQADPANAAPRFELATLLRYTNRRDEARQEIRAAQARLNPVDAHTVTEVTLALMDLEDTPDDNLPANTAPPRNLTEAMVAANASIRRGDFAAAAALLKAGRDMTNPDIFYYLTSDPVFRRYRDRPELAEFLQ